MTSSPVRTVATVFALLAALVVAALITVVVLFWMALRPTDGDDVATGRVENVARALVDELSDIHETIDAETVAAEWLHSRSADVEALSWTGSTSADQTATIDVRISAAVVERSTGGIFARYTSAGSATKCFRFTVGLGDPARYETISCDGVSAPAAPPVSQRPVLPEDAAERVERILGVASSDDLTELLYEEFPGEDFAIDTIETSDGDLVAAVGVTPGTDCVLRVRASSGAITAPSYDRIWLEPGELGCSVELYTAPPR